MLQVDLVNLQPTILASLKLRAAIERNSEAAKLQGSELELILFLSKLQYRKRNQMSLEGFASEGYWKTVFQLSLTT